MSKIITFAPAPSLFGFGALDRLPELLRERGFERVLLFTDPYLAGSGLLERVADLLGGLAQLDVYATVPAEPKSRDMERARFDGSYDVLIGLGGGSSMDFAKAVSVLMAHGGSLGDYVGEGLVPGPTVPVVCVPTTSGTGSQSTQTTVFTIDGVKRGISSEAIRPVLSVVDPELTLTLPPEVTRNAGYDALMHAVESFLARPSEQVPERPIHYQGSNPYSRSLSLEAFRSIWASYRRVISHGDDRQARAGMSLGSHLAGLAFSHSGLGVVHALASSLGGMIDAPHGVCLAACTDMGLRYNANTCEAGLATLGQMTGAAEGSSREDAERFLAVLQKLIRDLGLPTRPSQLGITRADAGTLLEKTLVQVRRLPTNPRPVDEDLLSAIEKGI